MGENTEKIICSCCGKVLSASQKFCPDCGTPLGVSSAQAASGAGTAKADNSAERRPLTPNDPDAQPVNIYPDDSGLKLMKRII